ncbi:MAG: 50S ribosomal protein L11 methyltransferase [Pseudomonadota bacterium]|nr:50S ribosomal protein L11 methyltransferase [Pseudomonadota bacterium]
MNSAPTPSAAESPVQIIARGPRADAEAAAAALDADPTLETVTYSILEEDEDQALWRIDAYPVSPEEADALRAHLARFPALETKTEVLADADWLAMALSGLPPVRAGRFFVYGAHDRGKVPPGTVALRIEAGAAFGTGHHGTTTGCLEAYDALLSEHGPFGRVLDVGCGTGVLAIAAARTGSALALGTDIDPVSVRIANENAALNEADARFVHAQGLDDPAVNQGRPYDLVFANILAQPLVELAPAIAAALRPAGSAILSGLLRTQEEAVMAAYAAAGFSRRSHLHKDAWSTLVLTRNL